jgi:FkbM family methyltransferase
MSLFEELSSRVEGLASLVRIFLKYRRTYRNYFDVFLHVIKKEYPFQGILKSGERVELTSFFQSYNLAQFQDHHNLIDYKIMTDEVTISSLANPTKFAGNNLKFEGGIHNGELVNIFLEDVYRILPVRGKTVIDIGANIGDSCIYFALSGASRVIGIEPFPDNHDIAIKNVGLNNLSDRISMILANCSAKLGSIKISDGLESGIASHTDNHSYGTSEIPSVTLENILNENNIQDGETILKMDCEGCEYEIILPATDSLLRQFSHMLIEYHEGYKDLKERLEKSSFEVRPIKLTGEPGGPIALPKVEKPGEWYYIGYIYAERQNKSDAKARTNAQLEVT